MSARMGHGPRLPGWQLAVALLADRVRTALGRAGAVFRCHPAGITVPVMMASGGAIAFLVLSAVSGRVLHEPNAPGSPPGRAVPAPWARPGTWPVPGRAALVPRQVASDTDRVAPVRPGPTEATPRPGPPRPAGRPGATAGASPGASPGGMPVATPSGTPAATPSGSPRQPPPDTPAGLVWPSPSPPDVSVCVGVGQQGICGSG